MRLLKRLPLLSISNRYSSSMRFSSSQTDGNALQDMTDGSLTFKTPLKIILYPDPRLRSKNRKIDVFDEKLEKLVQEMFNLMYKMDGLGLSAPQVGVNVQLMVFNPEGEKGKGKEYVFVNPKIYKYAKKFNLHTEGCLSLPGIKGDVKRPASVRVDAQDIEGKKLCVKLKELPARIFQHEYDHLQSVLYFERMELGVLESIIPHIEMLEKDFEKRTGLRAPEKVSDRIK